MDAIQLLQEDLWSAVVDADCRLQSLAREVLRGCKIDESCLLAAAHRWLEAWAEFESYGPRIGSSDALA